MAILVGAWLLYTTSNWVGPATPPRPRTDEPLTTFAEIKQAEFLGGRDKRGTDGTLVWVENVVVHRIGYPPDGDWNMRASDPTTDRFVIEIIPRDQGTLQKPPLEVPLRIKGIPFCDAAHGDEAWHGSTCWEVHPVVYWEMMA